MRDMTSVSIDGESWRLVVAAAQRGSRVAADRLVREHDGWLRSAVYATTGRADLVDDIVQQVWMRVWERLGTLQNPGRLRAWLYAIARNTAIDACVAHRQQRARVGPLDLERADRAADGGPAPVGRVAGRELRQVVLRAVQALPAIYREPLVLRYLEGWSYARIGEVLDLPVETVETRLVRGRRLLREMLQDKVEV